MLEELARRLAEVIGYVGSVEDGVAGFGDHVVQAWPVSWNKVIISLWCKRVGLSVEGLLKLQNSAVAGYCRSLLAFRNPC